MPLYSQLWFITAETTDESQQRKKAHGPSLGRGRKKFSSCSSEWRCMAMHLIPQTLICDNMCEVLPTGVAHLSLDVKQFLLGVTQMTGLGYSDSSSLPIFQA